ncbi:LPXTG cell wall anchor domain-containing protein [Erwinia sp. CPCC 100877]|nr:LPXTG cell wall anchor domain-containing protein [Erwinia sp. CPCC 100877]
MKKIVYCWVALSLISVCPVTVSAEEHSQSSEESTILDSSNESSEASAVSEEATASTTEETAATDQNIVKDLGTINTSVVISEGEKLTAKMFEDNAHAHSARYEDLELLEDAPTDKTGKHLVKVRFVISPLIEGEGEKQTVTAQMDYLVVKGDKNVFYIQFISYDAKTNEVKGRVGSENDSPVNQASIYGLDVSTITVDPPETFEDFYTDFLIPTQKVAIDADGYFVLPYKENYRLTALNMETGEHSVIYTLDKRTFTQEEASTASTESTDSTQTAKKTEDNKKGLFPNTGEKKGFYLSIIGIAIILLMILFLFIKSKKGQTK